jgi:hypothetical protein
MTPPEQVREPAEHQAEAPPATPKSIAEIPARTHHIALALPQNKEDSPHYPSHHNAQEKA